MSPRSTIGKLIGQLLLPLLLASCSALPGPTFWMRETETVRRLVILYTNDEHGWMEPSAETAGAGGMLRKWQHDRGYEEGAPMLVLSGGDMWTGPAISTTLEGESMTDIMNRMGYDAAAIGNHDFDFGVDALRARAEEADFPFLSANLRDRETGEIPDFVEPYVIREVNGIRVGIIGLTTLETRVDTPAFHIQGIGFRRYEDVLPEVIPEVQSQDVDVVLLIGHLCNRELRRIADYGAKYNLPLMAGGHCHEEHNEQVQGVQLIESGYFLRGYALAEIFVNTETDSIEAMDTWIHRNEPGASITAIDARIAFWRDQTDPALWRTIGYTEGEINRRSEEMDRLLTDAWLRAVPEAEVAMASRRYVQQSIPPGEITEATIVGVLPVDNVLMLVELTGEELVSTIRSRDPVLGGARWSEEGLELADGTPVDPEGEYQVVLPNVIYFGANYYEVQQMDLEPVDTGIPWREPVIEYLESLESSEAAPLDGLLSEGPVN